MANASPNAREPNATIYHLLALGLALGHLGFALGPRGFLDTNMLVSVTRNHRDGGRT